MPYPATAGGGGVGALIVATRSDNSQPAVFADVAARDTYTATSEGTADAARINVLTQEDAREVFAIGTLTGSDVTAITAAYIRLNGAWVSVATNLVGTPGQDGQDGQDGTANVPNLTSGQFVMGGTQAGTLVPAAMTQRAAIIESTMPQRAPGQDAFNIGPVSISSAGSTLAFQDNSRTKTFRGAVHEVTEGSGLDRRMFYSVPVDSPAITASSVTATERFPGTTLQAAIVNANTGTASEYRNITRDAGATEITGANLIIRRNSHTDANPVFDYKRDVTGGAGFTLTGGAGQTTTTIDLNGEYLFLAGETLYITIEGDGSTDLDIMGQTVGGQTIPFVDVYGRTETITFLEDNLGNPASNGQILSSTTAGVRSWIDPQGGGSAPPTALTNFSIDVPATVNVGTDLNTARTVQYTTTNTADISTLELVVTTGTNRTLTVPTLDGSHSANVTLAGISTAAPGTVTFQLRATLTDNTVITSNSQSVTIRAISTNEQAYYGVRATNDFSTVDINDLTAVDVQPPGRQYTISGTWPATEVIGILEPSDRTISSIVETAFNQETLSLWSQQTSVRTIDGRVYNLLTQTNNGPSGTFEFRVTHA